MLDVLLTNLLSPIVLAFALGILASLARSDLEIPAPLYQALSIYLLLAIGLKGGAALRATPLSEVVGPMLLTFGLGVLTPITSYNVLRKLGKMDRVNAAALAAHFGSVSAVTFIAAQAFGTLTGFESEGYMPALVAILEIPAIVVALMIANVRGAMGEEATWQSALHEVLTGRSIVLLGGGLAMGLLTGPEGLEPVAPFFVEGFKGALVLFLLELGLVTARRLRDLKEAGWFLVAFSIVMPIIHGVGAVWLAGFVGMSIGGAAVLGAMVSSASYIAAPAAVRIALPQASPTIYLTAALGITFPFNLALGIPLYFAAAEYFLG
ncbi:MAG: sodium-dependent bicarbonate transport family permease [Bacteroidota bacterium]